MDCSQKGCASPAEWAYNWLGREMHACQPHFDKAVQVAKVFGIDIESSARRLVVTIKIEMGVEPPAQRQRRGNYDDVLQAIAKLDVGDPCAVKLKCDNEHEMRGAKSAIYRQNKAITSKFNSKWRYEVITVSAEMSLYVMKVKTGQ